MNKNWKIGNECSKLVRKILEAVIIIILSTPESANNEKAIVPLNDLIHPLLTCLGHQQTDLL